MKMLLVLIAASLVACAPGCSHMPSQQGIMQRETVVLQASIADLLKAKDLGDQSRAARGFVEACDAYSRSHPKWGRCAALCFDDDGKVVNLGSMEERMKIKRIKVFDSDESKLFQPFIVDVLSQETAEILVSPLK